MPEDETTTASEPAAAPGGGLTDPTDAAAAPAKKTAAKKAAAKKAPAKKAAAKKVAAKKAPAKKAAKKVAETPDAGPAPVETPDARAEDRPARKVVRRSTKKAAEAPAGDAPATTDGAAVLFQVPDAAPKKKAAKKSAKKKSDKADQADGGDAATGRDQQESAPDKGSEAADGGSDRPERGDRSDDDQGDGEQGGARRRRRRGGRRRRKPSDGSSDAEGSTSEDGDDDNAQQPDAAQAEGDQEESGEGSSRRRSRRRPRRGEDGDGGDDSGGSPRGRGRSRTGDDQITALAGSTRLEAKKQRRREGREAGRRRAPIVSEAEFLARREAVDRVMVIRQRDDLTQIGVLEDKVLVEHYVARESQTSMIGNVYLGRVQNVLPSMEAAFIDIGRGRNAVLYAGEVNWAALGHKDGQQRKIESVLSSGQSILVQVSKDPIGHKGARLTSQISLAGRFLVYVPDGTTSGISRKLPDTERNRLKTLLKEIVPDSAGVIVRTAAEGASEEELTRDVERLKARWEDIEKKTKGQSPQLLYGEPDLTLKVVRDLFTEDFGRLVIQGDDAWETVQTYVEHVAPDLGDRLEKYDPADHGGSDVFATYRLDEQIAKGLDRKVWLPSGGSLIIDRTEAMTVVDVNTGKFTGSGGNLEETVTKNNLEAAEEMVRQLRLRDIGGIIVVDFIDMVLESNRDLVLRRLVECLGRDRTRHQVAEVTSLGLVQMTRKRIGTGLIEAFGEPCEHCQGRGLVIHDQPVEARNTDDDGRRGGRRGRGGRSRGESGNESGNGNGGNGAKTGPPSPKDIAAMARPPADILEDSLDDLPEDSEDDLEELTPAVEAPEVEPVETHADAPAAEEPEPEPEPEPAAAPEKPTVVTRTRRRSASRPAGPPVAVPALDGAADGPAVNGVAEHGGSASSEPEDGEDSATAPQVEHVPIKRKGSRKR